MEKQGPVVLLLVTLSFVNANIKVTPTNQQKGDTITLSFNVSGNTISWIKDDKFITSCSVSAQFCSSLPAEMSNAVVSIDSTPTSEIKIQNANESINGGIYKVLTNTVSLIINTLPTTVLWIQQPQNGSIQQTGVWTSQIYCVYPASQIKVEFEVYFQGVPQNKTPDISFAASSVCEPHERLVTATLELQNTDSRPIDVYIIPRAWHSSFGTDIIYGDDSNLVFLKSTSTALTILTTIPSPSPSDSSLRGNTIYWILATVLVVLIIMFGIVCYLIKKNRSKKYGDQSKNSVTDGIGTKDLQI